MRFLGTKCLMAQALSQALQNFIQQYRRIILQFGKIIEKKIKLKHQKTISIGEEKHLAISNLSSNAGDGWISDVELDLILREIEQYYSFKNQLRRKANEVDVDTIKKQIKEGLKKKIRITHKSLETHYDYSSPVKNSSCLEINVVFKMCKNCFL